ncbi:YolD-like family protein [Paenibacillus agricola]|uniref:YolD-like family protein n=1 Tax=Paenibacillus agricola TaxID=2716264 RepID=A0ABX0IZP6_9BACL|nr:YolD-like family protein [Paenibacillus agricola]NHN28279.1 YolD-like family protein [Paenibacillus agricola]
MAKAKQKRPTRDEFELEDLGNQIVEAKDNKEQVLLTVWGFAEPVLGVIVELDPRKRQIRVDTEEGVRWIPFLDVMRLDNPRY